MRSNATSDGGDWRRRQWATSVLSGSPLAYVLLALISNAGVLFINIMPALVGTLIDVRGFSEQQAGYVASANIYGAALGAFLTVMVVKVIPWKKTIAVVLLLYMAVDCLSALPLSLQSLIFLRFLSGVFGGAITTSSYAMMARLEQPDRAYGLAVGLGLALGGGVIYILPVLLENWGTYGLFFLMTGYSLIGLALVPFSPNLPIREHEPANGEVKHSQNQKALPLTLLLIGIFLFQAANLGIFSYQQRIGLDAGLGVDWVNMALAYGLWISIPTSMLVVLLGARLGHSKPILFAGCSMLSAFYLMHHASNAEVFLYASLLFAVAVTVMIPYMYGLCALLDATGKGTATANFVSMLGWASGPLIGAWLLEYHKYSELLNAAMAAVVLSLFFTFLCIQRIIRVQVS
ncbi:MFS transporter [Pseudomaricurvus alkylphenolicus]|uniref:MFS transporter n=1 Tax=Pseudomaricurvus alkylphenolicus TaxID=1306991 RepID=UPI00142498E3|nr:MFS transporter [Pseudomaricurvus alkylphenolicus]NIB38776.1 MFS transporter [Pseudomaricurvus alkylphenolicus]